MSDLEVRVVFVEAEVAGLIVLAPTGVWYEMQTGGYALLTDRAEGFYVPLSHEVVDHYVELHRYFEEHPELAKGRGIDEAAASFIDAELSRLPGHAGIVVDRARLALSREAWVYVSIGEPTLPLLLRGASKSIDAILVWPNSD